jgi:hypothetical protein
MHYTYFFEQQTQGFIICDPEGNRIGYFPKNGTDAENFETSHLLDAAVRAMTSEWKKRKKQRSAA